MKRLLKKLPHRHRDSSSDKRLSLQPDPIKEDPIKEASPRTETVFWDADEDDDNSNEPTMTASNGQPKTTQSEASTRHNRTSTLDKPGRRESVSVPYEQPVDYSAPRFKPYASKSDDRKSEHSLQLKPQDTSLFDDLSYLTLGGDSRDAVNPSRKRYSEDIADRNLMHNKRGPLLEDSPGARGSIIHTPAQVDEFSEDIADRNLDASSAPELSRSSKSNTGVYPLKTQTVMDQRISALPFSSDEFYDPHFEQRSASSGPSSLLLTLEKYRTDSRNRFSQHFDHECHHSFIEAETESTSCWQPRQSRFRASWRS